MRLNLHVGWSRMSRSFSRLVASGGRCLLTGCLAGLMLMLPAGCSLFVPSTQQVTLRANDPAAALYVDGRQVGTGTATVQVERNESHVFRAETPDGRYATDHVGRVVSTTGVLDVVGGALFLVPFLGILGPGFWSLDQTTFYLDLQSPAPNPASTAPATAPGQ